MKTNQNPDAAPVRMTEAALRGFGPLGVLALVLIFASSAAGFIVAAALVLVWARLSNTPLTDLGFTTPNSWVATIAAGVAFGVILKLLLKAVVMPLIGAPAVNTTYQYLVGNTAALPWIVAKVLISAAIGEEFFFRGYLFERMGALFGRGKATTVGTIFLSAALFASAHYADQGIPGVEQATMTGLVLGTVYAWRRQIWLPMFMHAAYDLTAIVLIYRGWEEALARSTFH
jgi:membrane protease YdiL (CAAX protease family)